MSEFFNVTITGEETLSNDLNDFLADLTDENWSPIYLGLASVADAMTQALQAHIQKDVYDEYEPKSYPRRHDNSRFGLALDALENKDILDVSYPNSLSMSFVYTPTGFHSGKMQDARDAYDKRNEPTARTESMWNDPLKPHPVHGDALIKRIQTGKGYDWKPQKRKKEFPARPFWNNFVEELKNGLVIDTFIRGISRDIAGVSAEGGDRDIEWGASEGMLEGPDQFYTFGPDDQITMW